MQKVKLPPKMTISRSFWRRCMICQEAIPEYAGCEIWVCSTAPGHPKPGARNFHSCLSHCAGDCLYCLLPKFEKECRDAIVEMKLEAWRPDLDEDKTVSKIMGYNVVSPKPSVPLQGQLFIDELSVTKPSVTKGKGKALTFLWFLEGLKNGLFTQEELVQFIWEKDGNTDALPEDEVMLKKLRSRVSTNLTITNSYFLTRKGARNTVEVYPEFDAFLKLNSHKDFYSTYHRAANDKSWTGPRSPKGGEVFSRYRLVANQDMQDLVTKNGLPLNVLLCRAKVRIPKTILKMINGEQTDSPHKVLFEGVRAESRQPSKSIVVVRSGIPVDIEKKVAAIQDAIDKIESCYNEDNRRYSDGIARAVIEGLIRELEN